MLEVEVVIAISTPSERTHTAVAIGFDVFALVWLGLVLGSFNGNLIYSGCGIACVSYRIRGFVEGGWEVETGIAYLVLAGSVQLIVNVIP